MPKFLTSISQRLGIVKELFSFLAEEKMWWLVPIVAALLLLGLLLIFAQSSVVAPFIYTLF